LKRNLNKIWSYKNDFKIGMSYSIGLIMSKGKPLLKVIESITGMKTINLSYFLREEMRYWEINNLFEEEIKNLEDEGEIILDEVIFPKENTTEMDAHLVHCSSQKRVLKGQEYLVLIWVKGNKTVVIDFLMIKDNDDERLKKSIELIEKFLKTGKKVIGLRVDGWFFKEDFVKEMTRLKVPLTSKPRRDSKWFLGNQQIQLNKYARTLSKDTFHYYPKEGVYAKSIIVSNQKYYYCKVVIIRPKYSSSVEDYIYVVSTDKTLTTRGIINGMRTRWKIEVVFRDCSQNLGLKDCQVYKDGSETHVGMVFLTYNFLSSIKEKEGGTIGKIKRKFIKDCESVPTKVMPFYMVKKVA
jgi:hypothetical protein